MKSFKEYIKESAPRIVVDDSTFEGKTDPTQYSDDDNVIYVKSTYDVKNDPEAWIVHELIHGKRIPDDGAEYPYNKVERIAYTEQFTELIKRGFTFEDISDMSKFPTLSIKVKKFPTVLYKYWKYAESYNRG